MLNMAARGHRVMYAGCVGMRPAIKLFSRGQSGCVVDGFAGVHDFQDDGGLLYHNLSYSPWAWRFGAARMKMAADTIERRHKTAWSGHENAGDRLRVAWIYHPGLLDLARALRPDMIIYDIMDRFTEFTASMELADKIDLSQQERAALMGADVIFTGGHSLHTAALEGLQAGNAAHKPVHCFPSGVDIAHFAQALDSTLPEPSDMTSLPKPIFGYFGAIDERLDIGLLGKLGRACPACSIVMVGPVLQPADISEPNIHFVGPKSYACLPQYLKTFNVCLLPFKMTPLVAHISPTKTPEYLAGGRPVVSAAIPDVAADWGDIVRIAKTCEDFIAACNASASKPPDPATLSKLAASRSRSWAIIADEMENRVNTAIFQTPKS